METRFGISLTATALILTGFALMFGFLYARSRAEPEYRGAYGGWLRSMFLIPMPGAYSEKGRPSAVLALCCLIALTFVCPAAGTVIEKGAHLFGKPAYLPSGMPIPPMALEVCFASFFSIGLLIGVGCLALAASRLLFGRKEGQSSVRYDLLWSGGAFLFAFAHLGWMNVLRRMVWSG